MPSTVNENRPLKPSAMSASFSAGSSLRVSAQAPSKSALVKSSFEGWSGLSAGWATSSGDRGMGRWA